MRSRDDDNKLEAHEPAHPSQPAPPQPHSGPAPSKPGLSLEERVAKLEAWIPRLEAIIGAP